MSVGTRPLTAEELLAMPDDGMRHELARGELTTMVPPGSEHGFIALTIGAHLRAHVQAHDLGRAFVETAYILSRQPDTVRAPDVSYLRKSRLLAGRGYYPGAPDVAVEVMSPTDRRAEVEAKTREYLAAGTPMVIVVDTEKRTATVHIPTATTHLGIDDVIDGGDVVPGWKLPLREIFE